MSLDRRSPNEEALEAWKLGMWPPARKSYLLVVEARLANDSISTNEGQVVNHTIFEFLLKCDHSSSQSKHATMPLQLPL